MAKGTVTVNFSKVTDFDIPVDASSYPVKIISFTEKKSADRKDGSDYDAYIARAEITEGKYAGRNLFCFLDTDPTENDNGYPRNSFLYQFLKALGFVKSPTEISFDPEAIPNMEMVWEVGIRDGQNQVKKFHSA